MTKWIKNIPEGTKDGLFEDCKIKRKAESALKEGFEKMGYNEIITPSIEFFDVFFQQEGFDAESMYKLFDSKNRLLVLRPDCTTPIARVVSTRLKDAPLPLRLYYNQNIFRTNDNFNGKRDEVTQCGVELIGAKGIKADVDIIASAVISLKRCYGENFKIEIGHEGLFNSLVQTGNIEKEDEERIRRYIENKNIASLNNLLKKYGDASSVLRLLPKLFGGIEVIDEALKEIKDKKAVEIVNYLKNIYDELKNLGLEKYIMIDLGLIHKINFYTGIIFRGYIEGSGLTVLSGGRYDTLLSKFGYNLPATGFAVNVDAIVENIKINNGISENKTDIIIFYENGFANKAYACMKEYIEKGLICEMAVCETLDEAKKYALSKKICKIKVVSESIQNIEI